MKQSAVHRFTTLADESGERLDTVIPRHCPTLSRGLVRKVIDLGGAHLDGRRVRRCSQPVCAGQKVEVFLDGQPLEPWALDGDRVLAEDPYVLVINKPAGIETQPTPARFKGTLYQALQVYLQQRHGRQQPELGMVQRLDRGTSGVMIFSIHKRAHRGLTLALTERQAHKSYLALVQGVPAAESGEIRSLLARNRASNLMRSVAHGGKEAVTRYRVRHRFAGCALLEVELLTGRSHQIRAHMSEAGHPLIGDVRYGGPPGVAGCSTPFPMLHSWELRLPHPVSGAALDFLAPLPELWKQLLPAVGATEDMLIKLETVRSSGVVVPEPTEEKG